MLLVQRHVRLRPTGRIARPPIGEQASARALRKGFRQRIAIARDHELFGEAVVEGTDRRAGGREFLCRHPQPALLAPGRWRDR